nr:MAG TPA: hypothetical protein [Caudoviricetes sp.]
MLSPILIILSFLYFFLRLFNTAIITPRFAIIKITAIYFSISSSLTYYKYFYIICKQVGQLPRLSQTFYKHHYCVYKVYYRSYQNQEPCGMVYHLIASFFIPFSLLRFNHPLFVL